MPKNTDHPAKHYAANRKRRSKSESLFRKILIGTLCFLLLVSASVFGAYYYLRCSGKNSLTVKVDEVNAASAEDTGDYITYNGERYRYNENIINILFMGIDKSDDMDSINSNGSSGQSDANFLLSLDTESKQVKLIALPRDTAITVKELATNGDYLSSFTGQLAMQYAYGRDPEQSSTLTRQAVSNLLYNLPISKTVSINLSAIGELNDSVGGVTLTSIETVGPFVEGVEYYLTGENAVKYVRSRNTSIYGSATNLRLARQKQYLMAFFDQAKTALKQNISLAGDMYSHMMSETSNMYTDLSLDDVVYLASEMLSMNLGSDSIITLEGTIETDEKGYELFVPDQEALKEMVVSTFYEKVEDTLAESGE